MTASKGWQRPARFRPIEVIDRSNAAWRLLYVEEDVGACGEEGPVQGVLGDDDDDE